MRSLSFSHFFDAILSVPVQHKIIGIVMLPVLILGLTLNYWITTGLSDWLSYFVMDQRVQAAMANGSRSVLLVTVLAAAGSIVFAFLLTFLLTQPLLELRQVAEDVSQGRLDARARVYTDDDIGKVAASVNVMLDRLVDTQRSLAEANQRLEVMNRVAMAAGREQELPEVLDAILQGFDQLGLDRGWIYLRDSDTGAFYLAHHRNMPAEALAHLSAPTVDQTLCGCQRDLVGVGIDHAMVRTSCRRLSLADGEGTATHISIPLSARGQAMGVVNLGCPPGYTASQADLDLLTATGAQAAEIVSNAWLRARLVEKEAARRALLESLVRTQEAERSRLARELHDGAGQTLTTLLVRLKALERQASGSQQADLVRLQTLVADSIEQVRELSYQLRPATLEEFGLARALDHLVNETVRQAGLEVSTELMIRRSIPNDVQTALYRIAQEGLANVLKHAHAWRVEVELAETPFGVALRIEDNGRGFDAAQVALQSDRPHLGLIGMQERVELLGGTLMVEAAPGAGTSIRVRIPLPDAEGHS